MTISLTGAGSLGVRWGHMAGWMNDVNSFRGGSTTANVSSVAQLTTRRNQQEVDFAGGTADYPDVDGLPTFITGFQASMESLCQQLSVTAQNTLITMANADTPLTSKTVGAALALLVAQMTAASASINYCQPAVAAQTAMIAASPVGNPTFLVSMVDGAGRTLQYVFPETLTVTMAGDSQSGSTAGQEPYSVAGQNSQGDTLAQDWLSSSYGSGASLQGVNLVDGSVSNTSTTVSVGSGNLTVNGDFRTYTTTNYPDNWAILVGVVTTDVANGAGTVYLSGGGSVQLKGDGATLVAIAQPFSTTSGTGAGTGGTPAILVAGQVNNAVYAVSLYYKNSNASPSTGVLKVDLVDGSNATIADDAGNNNSTTVDLTAIANTTWHNLLVAFRLPKSLPSTIKLRISQSTAIASGKSVYIADVAMCQMSQLYAGGPFVAGFSGTTKVNASGTFPDQWTFAVTNTVGSLAKFLWRTVNPASFGLIIPNSASPTVADSLVV